jgi:hypothetical protein
MPQMKPVENAERQTSRARDFRIVRAVKNFHTIKFDLIKRNRAR